MKRKLEDKRSYMRLYGMWYVVIVRACVQTLHLQQVDPVTNEVGERININTVGDFELLFSSFLFSSLLVRKPVLYKQIMTVAQNLHGQPYSQET
jgi:hypothetical protein